MVLGLVFYYSLYVLGGGGELLVNSDLKNRLRVIPYQYLAAIPNDWKLAYAQYATNIIYLQLALANFLHLRLGRPLGDLVVLYNGDLEQDESFHTIMTTARGAGIKLKRVDLISTRNNNAIWQHSFTKLHVFNLLEYDRVIYFDADSMLVNVSDPLVGFAALENQPQNLNELFFIPVDVELAVPQAYWLSTQELLAGNQKIPPNGVLESCELQSLLDDRHKFANRKNFFASHVMVIRPSAKIYERLLKYVNNPWYWSLLYRNLILATDDYDMEIINKFIDDDLHNGILKFGIIDHRIYGVLTGEFRQDDHPKFIADPQYLPLIGHLKTGNWDPLQVSTKLKLVHFSDEPIPKPWLMENNYQHYNTFKIYCGRNINYTKFNREFPINKPRLTDDCVSVELWAWFRSKFRETRNFI